MMQRAEDLLTRTRARNTADRCQPIRDDQQVAAATDGSTVITPKPRMPTLTMTRHTHATRIATVASHSAKLTDPALLTVLAPHPG